MTNEQLLIFFRQLERLLSENQMALNPEDTPRQNKNFSLEVSLHGNIPHSLEKVTHFISCITPAPPSTAAACRPLTSQYLENGATHTVFKVFTQHRPAPCLCWVPAMLTWLLL